MENGRSEGLPGAESANSIRAPRLGQRPATSRRAGLRRGHGNDSLTLSVDLAVASKAAVPGDLFLLHSGVYQGPWVINRSGTPAKPIVWRGLAGNGTTASVVIDGQGASPSRPAHAIEASGTHDVWLEDLTIQNAMHGVTFHDSARIVVRRCHIQKVEYGMNAARNTQGTAQDHFIADNLIEGPSTLAADQGNRKRPRHPDHRRGARRLLQPHPRVRRRHRHVSVSRGARPSTCITTS